jgi:hypothetical protein
VDALNVHARICRPYSQRWTRKNSQKPLEIRHRNYERQYYVTDAEPVTDLVRALALRQMPTDEPVRFQAARSVVMLRENPLREVVVIRVLEKHGSVVPSQITALEALLPQPSGVVSAQALRPEQVEVENVNSDGLALDEGLQQAEAEAGSLDAGPRHVEQQNPLAHCSAPATRLEVAPAFRPTPADCTSCLRSEGQRHEMATASTSLAVALSHRHVGSMHYRSGRGY